jgi:hypothetical protein
MSNTIMVFALGAVVEAVMGVKVGNGPGAVSFAYAVVVAFVVDCVRLWLWTRELKL